MFKELKEVINYDNGDVREIKRVFLTIFPIIYSETNKLSFGMLELTELKTKFCSLKFYREKVLLNDNDGIVDELDF